MIPVVISLSISPRLHAPLGFYLTAAAVGMLARITGRQAVLTVNMLGARRHTTEEAAHYLQRASAVSGAVQQWTDTDADWPSILSEVVARGTEEGWLVTRETDICHCDCGLLEYPADTPPDLDKRAIGKVYERRSDGLYCLHCGARSRTSRTPSLYLTLPAAEDIVASPKWAESEIKTFSKDYAGRAILVSRRRHTGLMATVNDYEYQLDPDLALMLLPFALRRDGLATEIIVTGNRTLKQAFLAAVMNRRLGMPTPSIVALPMVTFTDDSGEVAATGDETFAAHGSHVIRTVLAMAMGPTPKEVKLPTRSLHLVTTSLAIVKSINGGVEAGVASWPSLGKNKIEALLATVRRRQPLTPDQAAVLHALCA